MGLSYQMYTNTSTIYSASGWLKRNVGYPVFTKIMFIKFNIINYNVNILISLPTTTSYF